jgi:cytochrome c1
MRNHVLAAVFASDGAAIARPQYRKQLERMPISVGTTGQSHEDFVCEKNEF